MELLQFTAAPELADPRAVDHVLRLASPLLGQPHMALVLRLPPRLGPTQATPLLSRAFARRFPPQAADQLRLVWTPTLPPLGPRCFRLGAGGLDTPEAVAAYLAGHSPVTRPGLREAPSGAQRVANPAWLAAAAQEPPRLSLIVPTYGRPRALPGLLTALRDQVGREGAPVPSFEVIVVDDGSPEPVATLLDIADWTFPLAVLRQDNAGPAAARNKAVADSRGAILLSLNDDAVPSPTLLFDTAAAWAADPTPRLLMGRFRLIPACHQDSFADLVESSRLLFPQPLLAAGEYNPQILCTGNASLPRALWNVVGGMDETIRAPGGEDTEFGRRLGEVEGVRCVYAPELDCGHDHLLTVRGFRERKQHLGRTVVYLSKRWADPRILLPGGPPVDELFDIRLARTLKLRGQDLDGRAARLDEALAAERAAGTRQLDRQRFQEDVDDISELSFIEGLLSARTAASPGPRPPTSPPPKPR
jgi:GT2 family glycosyltransferase